MLCMDEAITFKPKQFNYSVLPRLLDTVKELDEDKEYTIKLDKVRKKRSLNANGYMWELCEQIAEKVGITKEFVYRKAIKDVGVFQTVEINEKAENTLKHSWSLHGIGWIAETVDNLVTRYVDQNSGKTTTMGREVNPYSTGEPNKDLFTNGVYDPSKAFGNGYQPNNIKGDKLKKVGTIDLTAELGRTQNVFKTSDGKCWVWDSPSNSYAQVKKKGSGWEFI